MVVIQIIKIVFVRYSSFVSSCHLFLISSASVRSLPFLSIMPILAWHVPLISPIFSKRSRDFPILLFSSISLHCSLKNTFLFLLASLKLHSVGYIFLFLPCLLLPFSPWLFVKLPQTATLPSCVSFSLEWLWLLPPIQCYEPPSIVLQALCLLGLTLWIYLSPPLCTHKGFDLGHIWMA